MTCVEQAHKSIYSWNQGSLLTLTLQVVVQFMPRAYICAIDASIIHDTLAVIANEVKQSSKTKMHFLNHLDCHVGYAF